MFSSFVTFFVLFSFVFVSYGNVIHSGHPGGRIVGGTPANISNFPYQVSVLFDGNHGCGGSIIAVSHVLTAAHCTHRLVASRFSIRAGSSFHNSGGTVIPVAQIFEHKQFDIDSYDYDISVLRLSSRLTLGPNVAIINMIEATGVIRNGDNAVATGWGRLTDNGIVPIQLQTVTLPTITTASCAKYYGSGAGGITERMFCAGFDEGGKDTCQGDSGGPLVRSGILIGITSWGEVCGQAKSPGVFTKLSLFRTYVDGIIKS